MNTETVELAQKIIQEAKANSQTDLLMTIASMPISAEDKLKIMTASLAVTVDLIMERTEYLKTHMDRVEESLDRVAEDLKRIANLL